MKRQMLIAHLVVWTLLASLVLRRPGFASDLNLNLSGHRREHEVDSGTAVLWVDVQQQPTYNTPFLTDAELEDHDSMTSEQIRSFLSDCGSYFKESIQDVDDQTFEPSEVIVQAANQYQINPRVILVTLQKESSGVTRETRPSTGTMRALMGCGTSADLPEPLNTARGQLWCAAERFRAYHDRITNTGSTQSGWQVGVPKLTQDGVRVTPATKAVAGQFTYTPYAGTGWGGKRVCGPSGDEACGGVHLFHKVWNHFGFGALTSHQFLTLPFSPDPNMRIQQGWKYTWDGDAAAHRAIDYIKGTIDRSATWTEFDVLAAADGEACGNCAAGPAGSKNVWIKHSVEDKTFYTYYGHLSRIASHIPLGPQDNTVTVRQGEKIGISGDTGAEGKGIHLHFQLKDHADTSIDPYALNTTRNTYPDPNGTNGKLAGEGHYWTANPPVYPDIGEPDDTEDALEILLHEQSEFSILEPRQEAEIYFTLQNTGSRTWEPGHYALVNVNDMPLGARPQLALNNDVPSGQLITWRFSITAPAVPGVYRTEWQFSYDGQLMGPLLWTAVIVIPGDSGNLEEIIRSMIDEARRQAEEWLEEQWEELRRQIIEMIWAEIMRRFEEFITELCGGAAATMLLSLSVLWLGYRRSRIGNMER
jgi:murein DD-endopeptidase MepM/ murein hydrolase activator NlpD